jgi:hypothetical protein
LVQTVIHNVLMSPSLVIPTRLRISLISSSLPQLLFISMQFHCCILLQTIKQRLITDASIRLSCRTMQVATWTASLLDARVPVRDLATRVVLCGRVPVDTPNIHTPCSYFTSATTSLLLFQSWKAATIAGHSFSVKNVSSVAIKHANSYDRS